MLSKNRSSYTIEQENEILDKFNVATQHELIVAETLVKYMRISEKFFMHQLRGDAQEAQNYYYQLDAMPDDFKIKKTAWTNAMKEVADLNTTPKSNKPKNLSSSLPNSLGTSNAVENHLKDGTSVLESEIKENIAKLDLMVDNWQYVKIRGSKNQYSRQIALWKKAKKRWKAVLEMRKNICETFKRDFFELFEGAS